MIQNLFADIPTDLREEVFTTLVADAQVKIERIVSKGHTSPDEGWYDQSLHEWVLVLRGTAEIAFESKPSVTLGPGDYLLLPAHIKHRVDRTSSDPETVWLAVHYGMTEETAEGAAET